TLGLMVVIIFPLMVAIEALEASGALERISRRIEPCMGWLGLSGKAGFPLMAGLVFGLAYGAGVLLEASRDGGLTQKDKRLLCVFLVACHAAVEDTFLFVPLGVNPFLLLGGRLILAVLLTAAAARAAALASRLGVGMVRWASRLSRGERPWRPAAPAASAGPSPDAWPGGAPTWWWATTAAGNGRRRWCRPPGRAACAPWPCRRIFRRRTAPRRWSARPGSGWAPSTSWCTPRVSTSTGWPARRSTRTCGAFSTST